MSLSLESLEASISALFSEFELELDRERDVFNLVAEIVYILLVK